MSAENGKVVYLNRPKRFTLEEARSLVGTLREVTESAMHEANPLIEALQDPNLDEGRRKMLSEELQEKLNRWANNISALGAHPKGLWLVDFDSGGGYYCWRYNEENIEYFHGYDEGFSGRMPIQ